MLGLGLLGLGLLGLGLLGLGLGLLGLGLGLGLLGLGLGLGLGLELGLGLGVGQRWAPEVEQQHYSVGGALVHDLARWAVPARGAALLRQRECRQRRRRPAARLARRGRRALPRRRRCGCWRRGRGRRCGWRDPSARSVQAPRALSDHRQRR